MKLSIEAQQFIQQYPVDGILAELVRVVQDQFPGTDYLIDVKSDFETGAKTLQFMVHGDVDIAAIRKAAQSVRRQIAMCDVDLYLGAAA